MKREKLFFSGPAGCLEAVLEYPRNKPVTAAATVCHPHPQYEGTLENKVVYTLARAAMEAGAAALRFNFRGVGESEGGYGEGRGELEDFRAAERWLEARYPDVARWRLGFSFGAAIVIEASGSESCDRLVTVAPPADRFSEYGLDGEAGPRAGHWLLVQGDADEVVSPEATLAWARALASPPEVAVFEGVGHYFHGNLTALRERVREALVDEQEETG